jgi:polysaccharide export outer membrane protein
MKLLRLSPSDFRHRSQAPAWECLWERRSASQAGVSSGPVESLPLSPLALPPLRHPLSAFPISAFQRFRFSAFAPPLLRFQLSAFRISAFSLLLLISAFQLFSFSAFSQTPAPPPHTPPPPPPPPPKNTQKHNHVIAIRVFREPDLDSQCRISKDGTINFPLLGVVNIAGKTANDAAAYLAALLDKDYIIKPQVSVSVVAYVKQRYSVLGQVGSPGGYSIPEEQSLDLLSAIAAAGGFTRLANQSKVIVKRQENGVSQTYKLDARTYGKDRGAKPFVILPNDTIIVDERFF